jgi:hypothetical protein
MASLITVRLTAANLADWIARIDRLAAETPARWGVMTPAGMCAHLRRSLEISLGEIEATDLSTPLTKTLGKWLFFDLPLPWPKGKIPAPANFIPEVTASFEDERRRLIEALGRFAGAQTADPWRRALSPAFGMLTLRYWGRIHGRHMEHHLRQFGV